jgi:hypothetical protein
MLRQAFQPGGKTSRSGKDTTPFRGRIGNVAAWEPMTSERIAVRELGVFHVGQKTVTIEEVICAAHFRGELKKSLRRVCGYAQSGTSAQFHCTGECVGDQVGKEPSSGLRAT